MQHEQLQQGSDQWLRFRLKRIGASSSPIILKRQLMWSTPLKFYNEIITAMDSDPNTPLPKKESNYAMEKGNRWEEVARSRFELKHSFDCPPIVITDPEHEWLMASLDGWNIEKKIILEIKVAGKEVFELAQSGEVHEKYRPQLEHQLYIAEQIYGGEWIAYFWVGKVGKNPQSFREEWQDEALVIYKSDPELRAEWKREVFKFWNDNVQKRIPPEPVAEDTVKVSDPKAKEIFDDLHDELLKLKTIEDQAKVIKKRVDELKDRASSLVEHTRCRWNSVELTKCTRAGNVDYAKLQKETGVDVDQYRAKPSEYYTVRLVK